MYHIMLLLYSIVRLTLQIAVVLVLYIMIAGTYSLVEYDDGTKQTQGLTPFRLVSVFQISYPCMTD